MTIVALHAKELVPTIVLGHVPVHVVSAVEGDVVIHAMLPPPALTMAAEGAVAVQTAAVDVKIHVRAAAKQLVREAVAHHVKVVAKPGVIQRVQDHAVQVV